MGKLYEAPTILVPVLGRKGEVGDVGLEISELCLACKHYRTDGVPACDAFPDGIPDEIRRGDFDHRDKFEGDNGIRWDPEKE